LGVLPVATLLAPTSTDGFPFFVRLGLIQLDISRFSGFNPLVGFKMIITFEGFVGIFVKIFCRLGGDDFAGLEIKFSFCISHGS